MKGENDMFKNKIEICVVVKKHRDVINLLNTMRDNIKNYKADCKAADDSEFTIVNLQYKDKFHKKFIKALRDQGYNLKPTSNSKFMFELVRQVL